MSRIFWETNLWIYLLEDYGKLSKEVMEHRRNMLVRGDRLLTSALTLREILGEACRRRKRRALFSEV